MTYASYLLCSDYLNGLLYGLAVLKTILMGFFSFQSIPIRGVSLKNQISLTAHAFLLG